MTEQSCLDTCICNITMAENRQMQLHTCFRSSLTNLSAKACSGRHETSPQGVCTWRRPRNFDDHTQVKCKQASNNMHASDVSDAYGAYRRISALSGRPLASSYDHNAGLSIMLYNSERTSWTAVDMHMFSIAHRWAVCRPHRENAVIWHNIERHFTRFTSAHLL